MGLKTKWNPFHHPLLSWHLLAFSSVAHQKTNWPHFNIHLAECWFQSKYCYNSAKFSCKLHTWLLVYKTMSPSKTRSTYNECNAETPLNGGKNTLRMHCKSIWRSKYCVLVVILEWSIIYFWEIGDRSKCTWDIRGLTYGSCLIHKEAHCSIRWTSSSE